MKTDLFQSCGHCWVFKICWHIECSTFTASSFKIWNSSARIPSPPLALFVVMLPKAHLTSHSRITYLCLEDDSSTTPNIFSTLFLILLPGWVLLFGIWVMLLDKAGLTPPLPHPSRDQPCRLEILDVSPYKVISSLLEHCCEAPGLPWTGTHQADTWKNRTLGVWMWVRHAGTSCFVPEPRW